MRVSPVKAAKAPKYPTRLALLADSSLLEKRVPQAWSSNAKLAGALSFLLLACEASHAGDKPKAAIVAPVFEHGAGKALIGGVQCDSSVFLSEAEAVELIAVELSKAGIDASKRGAVLDGVSVKSRMVDGLALKDGDFVAGKIKELNSEKAKSSVFDAGKGIAVEFISMENYFLQGGVVYPSTLVPYDMKEAARYLSGSVAKQGEGIYFGAFYDPASHGDFSSPPQRPSFDSLDEVAKAKAMAKWKSDFDSWLQKVREKAVEESKDQLRLQVKDFVEWLKAQGAI